INCVSSLSFFLMIRPPPRPPLFPYTTLFRSLSDVRGHPACPHASPRAEAHVAELDGLELEPGVALQKIADGLALIDDVRDRHRQDRKSTRLNSSHRTISYAVFCLKKKKTIRE